MDVLFNNNHTVIEDLYNYISIHKVHYNSKNKIPDDLFKYLKTAVKLEKEIENTTKIIIEEIEKENLFNLNSKQLILVCEFLKNSNKNAIKYYSIKHVQVY